MLPVSVYMLACHAGPADHFATYAEELKKRGYHVQISATGAALKKFQERNIEVKYPFSLENLKSEEEDLLANEIAKTCSAASVVITDVGHAFDIKLHKAFQATQVPHYAYYDNPEPFVPGGYSSIAAQVMESAQGILFANETLAQGKVCNGNKQSIDFGDKKRFGVGYYPVSQAENIALKRKSDHDKMRAEFLTKNGIEDKDQKILAYFGGNNEEYFSTAFPAFLSFLHLASGLVDLNNIVILFQQHGSAKKENKDGQQLSEWLREFGEKAGMPKVILSDSSSDEAQVIANAVLYHQTSLAPQFALEEIPSIIQVSPEINEDILVKNGLVTTVTNLNEFIEAIKDLDNKDKEKPEKNVILNHLGFKEDWTDRLETTIKEFISSN